MKAQETGSIQHFLPQDDDVFLHPYALNVLAIIQMKREGPILGKSGDYVSFNTIDAFWLKS